MNQRWVTTDELSSMSNEELVNRFRRACSDGNEYDNRTEIEPLKAELLRRLKV